MLTRVLQATGEYIYFKYLFPVLLLNYCPGRSRKSSEEQYSLGVGSLNSCMLLDIALALLDVETDKVCDGSGAGPSLAQRRHV